MAGGDRVDGTLYKFLHRYADRPGNTAVVKAVEDFTAAQKGPVKAADVRKVAMRAAKDELVREGVKNPSADKLASKAYWGAAIAAEERPFTLAEDQRSTSKSVHYFVSGAIAARVASKLFFLPSGFRHWVADKLALGVGVLKECVDQIKGTGFNRHDLSTDRAGIRSTQS